MEVELRNGALLLAAYVANPPIADPEAPLLVLCHGYPSGALGAAATGRSYPALADRIANEGWRVVDLHVPRAAARRRATSRWAAGSTTCSPSWTRPTRSG